MARERTSVAARVATPSHGVRNAASAAHSYASQTFGTPVARPAGPATEAQPPEIHSQMEEIMADRDRNQGQSSKGGASERGGAGGYGGTSGASGNSGGGTRSGSDSISGGSSGDDEMDMDMETNDESTSEGSRGRDTGRSSR